MVERPSERFRQRLLAMQGLPSRLREALGVANAVVPSSTADVVRLTLRDCLRIAFENSREYQQAREDVFAAALDFNLEEDAFRASFLGLLKLDYTENRSGQDPVRGVAGSSEVGATQTFKSGAKLGVRMAVDVAKLLTGDLDSAYGLFSDLSLSVPLLRGAGRDIVTEPLTQAERNLMYAILDLERTKRSLAVEVARQYYAVLEQAAQLRNQEENLRGIELTTRRAEALGEAGRLPEVQVNLSRQQELTARDRLASAREGVLGRLDQFKVFLGLPADARVELDESDLDALLTRSNMVGAVNEASALRIALERRLDLRMALEKLEDARRHVRIAEDALRTGLSMSVSASSGGRRGATEAAQGNVQLNWKRGRYGAGLQWDWPWERTKEQTAYRKSLLALEAAARAAEAAEERVKSEVRAALRALRQSANVYAIQQQAVRLAQRRVASTELLLEAGRAQMRDVVEARDALLQAQNSLVSAAAAYRMAELEFFRALEMIPVREDGTMEDVHVSERF
jgi:outer membrane protein TolC